MRAAGAVVARMHAEVRAAAVAGATTADLDAVARSVLAAAGAGSNFLGYHGYPAVICASVNDVVLHGIPRRDVVLQPGDLLSVDCGAIVDGWHGDGAISLVVGGDAANPAAAALVATAEDALRAAMAAMVPGAHVGDIGAAVEAVARAAGYSLVEGYSGHGIGQAMHEWPDVPNTGRPGSGPALVPGVTLCVEPMLLAGGPDTVLHHDGWTLASADGSLGAHVEHTIVVAEGGGVPLTLAR
jgi:methionyl aminopeptidase